MPFSYVSIAHIIEENSGTTTSQTAAAQPVKSVQKDMTPTQSAEPAKAVREEKKETVKPDITEGTQMNLPLDEPPKKTATTGGELPFPSQDSAIPKALRDLMESNYVDEWDIQNVVAAKGYYPVDVKIRDYDADFINGCLIGAWPQVYAMIKEMKDKEEIPFNN